MITEPIPYQGVHCPTCASRCPKHGPDSRCKACDCIPLASGKCGFCNTKVVETTAAKAA